MSYDKVLSYQIHEMKLSCTMEYLFYIVAIIMKMKLVSLGQCLTLWRTSSTTIHIHVIGWLQKSLT